MGDIELAMTIPRVFSENIRAKNLYVSKRKNYRNTTTALDNYIENFKQQLIRDTYRQQHLKVNKFNFLRD